MSVECRPPPGTPVGTPCVLWIKRGKRYREWIWTAEGWRIENRCPAMSPQEMGAVGWRFHSLGHQAILLSAEAFDKVVRTINDPPDPSPAMMAAAKRYNELVDSKKEVAINEPE